MSSLLVSSLLVCQLLLTSALPFGVVNHPPMVRTAVGPPVHNVAYHVPPPPPPPPPPMPMAFPGGPGGPGGPMSFAGGPGGPVPGPLFAPGVPAGLPAGAPVAWSGFPGPYPAKTFWNNFYYHYYPYGFR